MIKTVLFLFSLSISVIVFSQSITSSSYSIGNKYNLDFCENNNDTLKFSIYKSKYYDDVDIGIVQFSDSLKSVVRYTIPTEFNGNDIRIIKQFSIGRNWIIISSFFNLKHKKQYVFARIIDTEGHRLTKWKKILDINTNQEIKKLESYKFTKSKDRNRFIVLVAAKRLKMMDSLDYSFVIFDRGLNILKTAKAKYGANSYHTEFEEIVLSDDNDVYLLGVEFYDIKQFHIRTVYKKKYTLFHYLNDSVIATKIKLDNRIINSLTMKYHKDTLYLGGYYSNYDYISMAGAFSMKYINDTSKLWSLQKFPSYIIRKYSLKDYIEKDYKDEMFRFTAQSIEVDSLDNVYIIGQRIFAAMVNGGGIRKAPLYEYLDNAYYNFDEVLLFKISNKDRWGKVFVSKLKSSKYSIIQSPNVYAYSFVDNKFYFVLNDRKVDEKSFSGRIEYYTSLYYVDLDGRLELRKKIDGIYSRTHYRGMPTIFHSSMYIIIREPHEKNTGKITGISDL